MSRQYLLSTPCSIFRPLPSRLTPLRPQRTARVQSALRQHLLSRHPEHCRRLINHRRGHQHLGYRLHGLSGHLAVLHGRDLRCPRPTPRLHPDVHHVRLPLQVCLYAEVACADLRLPTHYSYLGACAGLANTHSYALLLVLRCIQAAGSASVIAIGSGSIGDIAPPAERGMFMALFGLGCAVQCLTSWPQAAQSPSPTGPWSVHASVPLSVRLLCPALCLWFLTTNASAGGVLADHFGWQCVYCRCLPRDKH